MLGWGDLEGGEQWAVTYFAKTLFTPAGIDIYSRNKWGLSKDFVEEIKRALGGLEDEDVRKLAGKVFEVARE